MFECVEYALNLCKCIPHMHKINHLIILLYVIKSKWCITMAVISNIEAPQMYTHYASEVLGGIMIIP